MLIIGVPRTGIKRDKPEDIVTKLRNVDVLVGQGIGRPDAIWQVSITEQTYYRWKRKYRGLGTEQLQTWLRKVGIQPIPIYPSSPW